MFLFLICSTRMYLLSQARLTRWTYIAPTNVAFRRNHVFWLRIALFAFFPSRNFISFFLGEWIVSTIPHSEKLPTSSLLLPLFRTLLGFTMPRSSKLFIYCSKRNFPQRTFSVCFNSLIRGKLHQWQAILEQLLGIIIDESISSENFVNFLIAFKCSWGIENHT